jgi:D-xylose 1-dehydrogenase (NADP+, D-xylono-1,5-lactone-forming)
MTSGNRITSCVRQAGESTGTRPESDDGGSPVLRWGLLGTARINRMVIPPLRASVRNRLDAVASRIPRRAVEYAREWGIPRAVGSYEALLADPQIDVVYIALPNALHAEWAVRAVEAGKHVLCEKPLATSVAEVDAIADAAVRRGRVVTEAFMYRHHPQSALVSELVRVGAIGRVRLVRGSFRFTHTRPGDARWLLEMGGGCLWDVGCYPVGFARMVLEAEPVEVRAEQVLGPTGVDIAFSGVLQCPGGVHVEMDSSFTAPFYTRMEIVGLAGTIVVQNPFKPAIGAAIELTDARGQMRTIAAADQDLYSGEIEDLSAAVLDGTPPRVSLADSRGNTAALVALLEAARTGQTVRVQV